MLKLLARAFQRSTHIPELPYVVIDRKARVLTLRNRLAVLQQELHHTVNPANINVQIAVVEHQLEHLGATVINANE